MYTGATTTLHWISAAAHGDDALEKPRGVSVGGGCCCCCCCCGGGGGGGGCGVGDGGGDGGGSVCVGGGGGGNIEMRNDRHLPVDCQSFDELHKWERFSRREADM